MNTYRLAFRITADDPPRRRRILRLPATRPPLRRLIWTLSRLRSGRTLKATDVAEEFSVAVRTAYRDLDFLRDQWRAPVKYDHREQTYLLTEPTWSLPLVTLTRGEMFALFFAEKVLRQYRGTPYEESPHAWG